MPRLICERKGRITDDTHYGFEVRNSRLWTESEKLNERFKVTVSPFQDDNWLRQLFVADVRRLARRELPGDFSFELAYGSLLCSVEEDDPDAGRAGGALGRAARRWRSGSATSRGSTRCRSTAPATSCSPSSASAG